MIFLPEKYFSGDAPAHAMRRCDHIPDILREEKPVKENQNISRDLSMKTIREKTNMELMCFYKSFNVERLRYFLEVFTTSQPRSECLELSIEYYESSDLAALRSFGGRLISLIRILRLFFPS